MEAFNAGFHGDLKECKRLVMDCNADINMCLMGASPKNVKRTPQQKIICEWSLLNGACLLFSMWHINRPFVTFSERFDVHLDAVSEER